MKWRGGGSLLSLASMEHSEQGTPHPKTEVMKMGGALADVTLDCRSMGKRQPWQDHDTPSQKAKDHFKGSGGKCLRGGGNFRVSL